MTPSWPPLGMGTPCLTSDEGSGAPAPAENSNGLWLNKELHREMWGLVDGRGWQSPGLHTSQWEEDSQAS